MEAKAKSIYTNEDIKNNAADSAPLREGAGETCFVFSKNQTPENSPIKCMARVVLESGSSLRRHRHVSDGEIYYILSGTGEYYDNSGTAIPVKAGDATLCLMGDEHGISNTGSEPLVFMAVIN